MAMEKLKPMMRPRRVRVAPRMRLKFSRSFSLRGGRRLCSHAPRRTKAQRTRKERANRRMGMSTGVMVQIILSLVEDGGCCFADLYGSFGSERKAVRAWRECHRTPPLASWRGPRLIDDETVAKIGHPVCGVEVWFFTR